MSIETLLPPVRGPRPDAAATRPAPHLRARSAPSFATELSSARSVADRPPTIAEPNARALAQAAEIPRDLVARSLPNIADDIGIVPEQLPDESIGDAVSSIDVRHGDPVAHDVAATSGGASDADDMRVMDTVSAAQTLLLSLPVPTLTAPVPFIPQSLPDLHVDSATPAAQMPRTAGVSGGSTNALAAETLVDDHFDAPAELLATAPTDNEHLPIGGADPKAVQNALARLDPKFRARLERVIAQLEKRFGHSVAIVETVRSQDRQNALFAQGRTAPGPVVTWTRNSKHLSGLAADLKIDGRWSNPVAYARLAEIAKQEGLRTLGARDPGHVELVGERSVSPETLTTLIDDLTSERNTVDLSTAGRPIAVAPSQHATRAGLARVANVAHVARVASVAAVARVASVARPGEAAAHTAAAPVSPVSTFAGTLAVPSVASDIASSVTATGAAQPVDLRDRIAHLLDLQAAQDARPLQRVMLRMQNASGIEDQIRIDTRGTSVDAELGLGNARHAADLTERLGELRTALERRGLSADSVQIRRAPGVDSVQLTRAIAPLSDVAALRASSEQQFHHPSREHSSRTYDEQRDGLSREQARQAARQSQDDARNRSRREQQETRQ
jgi:hypothetical protein